MTTEPDRPPLFNGSNVLVMVAAMLAIFTSDLLLELGATVALLYFMVVAIHLGHADRLIPVALVATAFIIAEPLITRPDRESWRVLLSRGLAIVILWTLVLVLIRRLRRHDSAMRLQVERQLLEISHAERRLNLALSAANVGLWDWDPITNTVYYSPQFKKQIGYPIDEPMDDYREWESRLHPEDAAEAVRRVRDYFDNKSNEYVSTFRLRHRDGSYRWILSQGDGLRDARDRIVRMIGVHIDLTRQKQMEADLAQSEAKFRAVFSQTFQFIGVLTKDGIVTEVNDSALKAAGVARESVVGRPFAEAPWWSHSPELQERLRTAIEQAAEGQFVRFEATHPSPDGSLITVDFSLKPARDETGRIIFLIPEGRDVTELRAAERELQRHTAELERSNEHLNQFAYVASHDLRAPLRNIDALASWVEEDAGDALPQDCREHLGNLRSRVRLMDRLLNDLLQFSRVGRKESRPEPIDSGELLREVIKMVAPPSGFRIDVIGILPTVVAPRTALGRVFQNLIDNAIKHHHRPDGRIEVSAADRGRMVEFTVRDDGPGIAPVHHEDIFGIFQTLKRRDEHETSGMGLAIVRKTVEAYGGRVRLESDLGSGAAFHFTWPREGATVGATDADHF